MEWILLALHSGLTGGVVHRVFRVGSVGLRVLRWALRPISLLTMFSIRSTFGWRNDFDWRARWVRAWFGIHMIVTFFLDRIITYVEGFIRNLPVLWSHPYLRWRFCSESTSPLIASLLTLKVLFGVYQSFAPLLCFRLRGKHGLSPYCFGVVIVVFYEEYYYCDVLVLNTQQRTVLPGYCCREYLWECFCWLVIFRHQNTKVYKLSTVSVSHV